MRLSNAFKALYNRDTPEYGLFYVEYSGWIDGLLFERK
jgi:hypothetical protein